MKNLIDRLTAQPIIGLDTSIFIYHLEAHPIYLPLTQIVLSGVEAGKWTGITSTITLMEISVRPYQLGRQDIARKYEALLVNFPSLIVADIDREVARWAAKLRTRYNIRPADALQVAACLVHYGRVFVTNDRRLALLKPVVDVIFLDEFVERREH